MRLRAAFAACVLWLAAMQAPASPRNPNASTASMQGAWDLEWQSRRGTSPGGYLVISQRGTGLDAKLHGRRSVSATGILEGARFTLRGSRFFVPYVMTGTLSGDTIEGMLKVMSVERHFVGRRRHLGRTGHAPLALLSGFMSLERGSPWRQARRTAAISTFPFP